MDLKFNIVYAPGTVRYLSLFVFSLLKWSDSSFRLVANACPPEEVHLLQELCRKNSRLECLVLPSQNVMGHAKVLSHLQSLERSDYFCFMDSDILASGDFVSELSPYLEDHAGVFSAPQIWCTEEEQILPENLPVMGGRFNRMSNGGCIGSSHFAMYDNKVLTQFIQSTSIGFGRYSWGEIPAPYQRQALHMGFKVRYDTGKLLNVLLVALGHPLIFVDSQSLYHIGGFSGFSMRARPRSRLFRKVKRRFATPPRAAKAQHWIKRLRRIEDSGQLQLLPTEAEIRAFRTRTKKRAPTTRYFSELFHCLFENQPLPSVPDMGQPEIERRIRFATAHIVALYEEFGELFT